MTKIEDYVARGAESLSAANAATNARDRQFHMRAHSIWRKLALNVGEAEQRAALRAPPATSRNRVRPVTPRG